VQKHATSHLHYGFPIVMHDTLKPWAVSKGIPQIANETRTTFETEDHPIEYLQFDDATFEGFREDKNPRKIVRELF
jgi:bifunctional non-homologous end joining protein LigD